jgi:hypothetical protein
MNTPKSKDKLKNMFHEITMETLSPDFMKNLMSRVEKEVIAKKRKQNILNFALIIGGIISIFLISGLILYFLKIEITILKFQDFYLEFQNIFKNFSIDPKITGVGLIILLLLIGDLVFRKFSNHENSVKS